MSSNCVRFCPNRYSCFRWINSIATPNLRYWVSGYFASRQFRACLPVSPISFILEVDAIGVVGLVDLYHKVPQLLQSILEFLMALLEPMPRFVNDISLFLVDDAGIGRIQYPLRDHL